MGYRHVHGVISCSKLEMNGDLKGNHCKAFMFMRLYGAQCLHLSSFEFRLAFHIFGPIFQESTSFICLNPSIIVVISSTEQFNYYLNSEVLYDKCLPLTILPFFAVHLRTSSQEHIIDPWTTWITESWVLPVWNDSNRNAHNTGQAVKCSLSTVKYTCHMLLLMTIKIVQ